MREGTEYGLGQKDGTSTSINSYSLSGTMKFNKIRAVEEQIETLVDRDMT